MSAMSKVGRIESHCLFEVSCLNCVFYIPSCQHLGSILIIYEAVSLTQKPHGQALKFYGAISSYLHLCCRPRRFSFGTCQQAGLVIAYHARLPRFHARTYWTVGKEVLPVCWSWIWEEVRLEILYKRKISTSNYFTLASGCNHAWSLLAYSLFQ